LKAMPKRAKQKKNCIAYAKGTCFGNCPFVHSRLAKEEKPPKWISHSTPIPHHRVPLTGKDWWKLAVADTVTLRKELRSFSIYIPNVLPNVLRELIFQYTYSDKEKESMATSLIITCTDCSRCFFRFLC